jgi:flagellar basal-body rod protein FlgF
MSGGLYVAMSAASARVRHLDAVADTLANLQSPGFRPERAAFELVEGAATDGTSGHVAAVSGGVDPRPGTLTATGRALDVALEDGTWLSLQRPDGSVAYTRAGRLTVDPSGALLSAGLPVLSADGGPLTVPAGAGNPTVGADGAVRAGQVLVGFLGLVAPQGPMQRQSGQMVSAANATPVAGHVQVGHLEMGPTDAIGATVDMVSAQRQFDAAMQAVQAYRRLSQAAAEAGRVR